jgi:hypothetical protein
VKFFPRSKKVFFREIIQTNEFLAALRHDFRSIAFITNNTDGNEEGRTDLLSVCSSNDVYPIIYKEHLHPHSAVTVVIDIFYSPTLNAILLYIV